MIKTIIPTILVFCIILLAAPGGQAQDCVTLEAAYWEINTFSSPQNSEFTIEFDFTLSAWPMNFVFVVTDNDIVIADSAQYSWNNWAVLVGIDSSRDGDNFMARDGADYVFYDSISPAADVTYHNRVVVDPVAGTYDYFVTPEGGTEYQFANGFAYRAGYTGTGTNFEYCGARPTYASTTAEYCNLTFSFDAVVDEGNGSFASHWDLYE